MTLGVHARMKDSNDFDRVAPGTVHDAMLAGLNRAQACVAAGINRAELRELEQAGRDVSNHREIFVRRDRSPFGMGECPDFGQVRIGARGDP
jgi:hypothetical protein